MKHPATRRHRSAAGFTLIELVIAITISAIVVIFASMFISAPLTAYETHSRRALLAADAASAWPRMEADLRQALPNSLRTRRNAINPDFVVLEMLKVFDVARYMEPPDGSFKIVGEYRGATLPTFLSVNNLGELGEDAYAPAESMTLPSTITFAAEPVAGEFTVTVVPAPAVAPNSPGSRVYFVEGPVTYLCDEGQGTLRRYANYAIAASQISVDQPAAFAVAGELVAQGLTTCNFAVSAVGGNWSQTVAVRLTTARNGDSVTLLHSSRADYVP